MILYNPKRLVILIFIVCFVAVVLGNEATTYFDEWRYCNQYPASRGCGR